VVVGLFSTNDDKAYLEEVANLSFWCQDNSLMLNVSRTDCGVQDTQQNHRTYTPLVINGTAVDRVSSFRYLGVHIAEDLT